MRAFLYSIALQSARRERLLVGGHHSPERPNRSNFAIFRNPRIIREVGSYRPFNPLLLARCRWPLEHVGSEIRSPKSGRRITASHPHTHFQNSQRCPKSAGLSRHKLTWHDSDNNRAVRLNADVIRCGAWIICGRINPYRKRTWIEKRVSQDARFSIRIYEINQINAAREIHIVHREQDTSIRNLEREDER